ncbi:chondroitin sulfate proteoglycan 5 [Coregonus clupeaformis]|uniref:chondroitin sulfate proteoglycan 5 n=1 Tax=Coregonus clupeaformis TaxID=59861 RepID=UPI001BE00EC0|nr:chondroitin sulfate proteoglycan 5 [Coregonus clupeaformis]
MARWESWSWSWSLMLSFLLSLSAQGELSLATVSRTEVQHSQSSFSAVERAVLIGDDSAELIGIGLGLGAELPLSATKRNPSHRRHSHLDFTEEDDQPIREELTGRESQERSDDIIKVEFHNPDRPLTPDLSSDSDWLTAVAQPLQQRAGDPTAWTLSDFYDYLSPDAELSTIDTTLDPEPTLTPPADMEDENPSLTGSPVPYVTPDNDDPQQPSQSQPPSQSQFPSQSQSPPPPSPPQGSDGCGLGFVRSEVGDECVSQCDAQPDFCYNRGVCTIATGIGAFCRCNVQDYMWNKGSRCDWVVTDFQVLCVVVGVASLTLILLIIIIVFFAKRLHRLRIENRRLRKRSLYRPHSEMQTDGFSVSTAQDSSHANDDPQKMEEPVKSQFTQGEESMNIGNSHSPKHVNNCPALSSDHTPNADQEVNSEEANSSPSNNIY